MKPSTFDWMSIQSVDVWYKDAKVFNWNGHSIAYKTEKNNRPWLLLIHGFPTSSYDWFKIWELLSKEFSLVALDMIGFGYSDKPKNYPYSIIRQSDLVEDFVSHLDINEYHLLSHDYGDTVAQELVARDNESEGKAKIRSTCLLNGGLFPESHRPLLIQKMLMSPIGFILSKLLNQKKFEKSFGSIFGAETQLSDEELEEYWKLVSHKGGHQIAHLLIRYMRERVVNRERWVRALQNYTNPLGLINGLSDPISGQVMVDRYKEIISTDNIWTMQEIGHYPQVEAAEKVVECFYQFIEANTAADA
ncbi:MAG: alpha/beta hydrolase [Ekhidna sp.]|nr:alpha/beta hydrolase [Ekhidna sp.]